MHGKIINFKFVLWLGLLSIIDCLLYRYREKFGFPFVICARQNKKDAILNGIVHRLNNTADRELSTGIEEVKKICLLRLQNIAESSTS